MLYVFPIVKGVDLNEYSYELQMTLLKTLRDIIGIKDENETIEEYVKREIYDTYNIEDVVSEIVKDEFYYMEENCGGNITKELVNLSYLVYGYDTVSAI